MRHLDLENTSFWLAKARTITPAELEGARELAPLTAASIVLAPERLAEMAWPDVQCAVVAVPDIQCAGRWLGRSASLISPDIITSWFTRCENRAITRDRRVHARAQIRVADMRNVRGRGVSRSRSGPRLGVHRMRGS